VIQFTSKTFERAYRGCGADRWIFDMPGSLPRTNSRRWLLPAFTIYSAMIGGLVAFVTLFPNSSTERESRTSAAAAKPARYEAVIVNWNRYRARDARAEAR
jgi:hypothetical protein